MSRYRRLYMPGATYSFVVALENRQSTLLIDEIDRLRVAYRKVQRQYPFTTVAICILPDHLHAIWAMPPDDANYSKRWSLIKSHFSRGLPAAERSPSKRRQREKGIWQRRFWEHQIRDEQDLQNQIQYVHHNPVKHGLAQDAEDWPYSTIHKYERRVGKACVPTL